MSEYIAEFFDSPDGGPLKFDGFREEIVRCRDCKHRAGANVQAVISDLCMWLNIIVKPDGFCKWGVREDSE